MAFTAMVAAIPAAQASVMFDDWSSGQTVTATVGTPNVASTVAAPVGGVMGLLGDRTLKSSLTSPAGSVQAVIGGGSFECNRSVVATGFCTAEYEVLTGFNLASLQYTAINDGAFGGVASISFYNGVNLLATQVVSAGPGGTAYETALNTAFTAGDTFRMMLVGQVAIDQSVQPMEATLVPAPATAALLGMGFVGLGATASRRKKTIANDSFFRKAA